VGSSPRCGLSATARTRCSGTRSPLELVPEEELDELTHLYVEKGLSLRLARVLHRILILAMTTELRSAQAQYASPRDGSTVTTDAVA